MGHYPQAERWTDAHRVRLVAGTRLHGAFQQDELTVNSIHHQSVKDVGRGLVVSATSTTDGVVEGLELPDRRFVVGVQWHPEAYWDHGARFAPLFEAHVRAACRP